MVGVALVVAALVVAVSGQEEEVLVVVDMVQEEVDLDQAVEALEAQAVEALEAQAVVGTVTVEAASAEEALDRAMV